MNRDAKGAFEEGGDGYVEQLRRKYGIKVTYSKSLREGGRHGGWQAQTTAILR